MKRFFISLLCITFMLVGCGASKNTQLDLAAMRCDNGEYQYQDILWGSSTENVSKQLGITMDSQSLQYPDGSLEYGIEGTYQYGDLPVKASFIFYEDQLYEIDFLLYPSASAQETFDEISSQLMDIYGKQEVITSDKNVEGFDIMIHSSLCSWEQLADDYKTGLSILLTEQDNIQDSVRISVVSEKFSPRYKN